ncbi:sugar phosphate permease [Kitasatospora sp. SolWspMP-SS2h]|uniref:MFS transporter n=1 Tax=Kitasatospora TaxID=2063 RepID=UPI000DB90766|nr:MULTISPECIES: MFS transporter [Kitasatospora]RAJ38599.1 sugar phosphate permease [Kitasatospora sp. SolWspMP-SS2h]
MTVVPTATDRGESGAAPPSRFGPKHRWTVLGLGVAAQASFSASFAGIPVTGTTMRADYHLTTGQLGFVLGATLLGVAVSEIFWGLLTDRFGDRKILLTGLLSTGAVLALMAVFVVPGGGSVPAIGLLAAGLLLVGLLGGSVNGSSGRAVMIWFRDGERGFAMSIRQTAIPAGGAIGAALLPWLASSYGFRPVYGVLALFCFVTAAATWRWLHSPEDLPAAGGAAARAAAPQDTRSPLVRWDCWRLALASALLTMPQIAVLSFAGVFLHDAKHAGLFAASATILTAQIGGAAIRVWSGRYTDRNKNRRSYVRAVGVIAGVLMAGAAVLAHAPTFWTAAALAIGGMVANAWHGVAYTEIAAMAGAERAGTALGLENTTAFTGAFVTPMLIPLLLGVSSWTVVWIAVAVASLLAAPLAPGKSVGRPLATA